MVCGSDTTLFKRFMTVSGGAARPLHKRLQPILNSVHSPFHLPSHCGKDRFPFTTTTSRSFRPSPASVRKTSGKMAGGLHVKKSQRRVKGSLHPPGYKHAPAGRRHSLEPGRHLPARARAPAQSNAAPRDRSPTPPPNFRQGRLRSRPAA